MVEQLEVALKCARISDHALTSGLLGRTLDSRTAALVLSNPGRPSYSQM